MFKGFGLGGGGGEDTIETHASNEKSEYRSCSGCGKLKWCTQTVPGGTWLCKSCASLGV